VTAFYSNFEKALRLSTTSVIGGRLQGSASVTLLELASPGQTRKPAVPYELFGPGDVQRLAAGAITRRFPAPNASDAEVTKLALVEFAASDLPWRYTPELRSERGLRPWLVLVVGERAPDDIILRPDGRVTLGLSAQSNHNLVESAQWAHVQGVDGHEVIARLLSPRALENEREYVACLVPAFTAAGADSWDGNRPATCALYDTWTFRTGPLGDFHELAAKLHKADLAAISAASGKEFGRAEVAYRRRTTAAETITLAVAGALRLPPDVAGGPDPADSAPDAAIMAETAALTRRVVTADGRGVVTAPRYDAPFSDANAGEQPVIDGWIDQLRQDPRLRGAAGLGSFAAIEWQDRIADAAMAKAGDLGIAADRVRHVALGVEASRSLWRRRLPAPAGADRSAAQAAAERLALLSPGLARLVATTGSSVLDQLAGRTPQLSGALLSSAARRALRPGPARVALTAQGSAPPGDVLIAANRCARETQDPAEIRPTNESPARSIKRLVVEASAGNDSLADAILTRLGNNPSAAVLTAALRALAPGKDGRPDREAITGFLEGGKFPESDPSLIEWTGWMNEHAHRERCRPVDLIKLVNAVTAAIDPTVDRPPAVKRVLSTLPGISHIGPLEFEPELDLPLWSFLAKRAPDWMLPGAGDLVDGDVVGLSTNPAFVESLLVGANFQSVAELRWRNVPLVTRWSPLRKFWQRKSGGLDILPIKNWPDTEALGSAALVPPGLATEAVVAFRTSLFRRYPATVVYLYPTTSAFPVPAVETDLNVDRVSPSFTGTIGDDVTFFGFPLAPEKLATHWVVLEEPPAGYRFLNAPFGEPAQDVPPDSSANFAFMRFALPVRVLIGPLLENQ
jgi:hypothetical protein